MNEPRICSQINLEFTMKRENLQLKILIYTRERNREESIFCIFQLCFWYLQQMVVVSCYSIMGLDFKIIFEIFMFLSEHIYKPASLNVSLFHFWLKFAFFQLFSQLIDRWSVVFVFASESGSSLQCNYKWYREESSPWIS